MEDLNFKDILDQHTAQAGWPANYTPDEAFDLEYGTETTLPRPAIRKAAPEMVQSAVTAMLSRSEKYFR